MKRFIMVSLALALCLLCACGKAVPEETGATGMTLATTTELLTTTEESTTEDIPDPADNEPTFVLLERHAEEIMREGNKDGFHWLSFRLSKSKNVIGAAVGDLNGDGKPDLAVTVNLASGNDEEEDKRETYVLLAEGGKYKVRHKNSGLVRGPHEGGVFGDPFAGLAIEGGTLTVSLYGGSAWKWGHTFHFRYSGSKLMLTKTETQYHYMGCGTETICDYTRGTVESRKINFDDDDSNKGLLLHKGTFSLEKSTFDAPVVDDATYTEGVPNAPSISTDWYESHDVMNPTISAIEALEIVQKAYYNDMKKVKLPWTEEGKANYKKILGYDMPGWYYENKDGRLYYFSLSKKYEHGNEWEESWLEHTVWYQSFEQGEYGPLENEAYYINDATGEIL